MPEPPPLEAALDELYASDPSEFVSVRKHLASELRAAGDKAAAKELLTARRPSTSAWALSQVVRREPRLVEALLERSRELVAAQTRPASADGTMLRHAIRAHREALDEATDAALAILGPRSNDSFRGEVVSMLRAASTDMAVSRDLRLGRSIRDDATSAGFPELTGLTLVPASPDPSPSTGRKAAKRDAARELASKDRETAAAEKRFAKRRADIARRDEARRRAGVADTDATRAATRVEQLEAELETARRQLRDAQARTRKANDEAARLSALVDDP